MGIESRMTGAPTPERRTHIRRSNDYQVRNSHASAMRIAVGALVLWAVVGTLATVALYFQNRDSTHALSRADTALAQSSRALHSASVNYDTIRLLQVRSQLQVIAACRRLNTKQAEDNRNQRADFVFDRTFLALVTAMPPQSPTQARTLRAFTTPLRRAIRAKAWVPLVPDCTAVGVGFRPPAPVPFIVRQPPRKALVPPT